MYKDKITMVVLTFTVDFADNLASHFDPFFLFNIRVSIIFNFGAIIVMST